MAETMLEDAGDYVPYAKKHLAQPRTAKQDGISLDALWPEPDWRQ